MLLPARMRKLYIITLKEYAKPMIRALHEEGIVQIEDVSERIERDVQWRRIMKAGEATPEASKVSSLLMRVSGILDFFKIAEPKRGMMDTLKNIINPPIPKKREVKDLSTREIISKAEKVLNEVESKTKNIEKKLDELDSEEDELKDVLSLSKMLIDFDVDFSEISRFKHVSVIVGKLPAENFEKFKKEIKDITEEVVFSATGNEKEKIIFVIVNKNYHNDVFRLLRKLEFEKFDIEKLEGKPKEIVKEVNERLKEIKKEKKELISKIREIKREWENDLLVLRELLEIEKERNEIFSNFGETSNTVLMEAWVPKKKLNKAMKIIQDATDNHCVIEHSKGSKDAPILLDNPSFAKPFEPLLKIYSPPNYHEYDPTIFMAIIFPFFYGFCASGVFTGALVLLTGYILYRGLGKVNKTMKDFGIILIVCGVWALVWGLLTGEFFGDFLPRFLHMELPTVMHNLEPLKNPQNLLILALGVGLAQLILGLVTGAVNNIKRGKWKIALFDQISWLLLIIAAGIVYLGISMKFSLAMYSGIGLFVIALGLIVYEVGLIGLMETFTFLGRWLSYSRLTALCIAGSSCGMAVNILVQMSQGPTIFNYIIMALIFVSGHLAFAMLHALVSFIHSLRLHYVEFFEQFYEGEGREFIPFSAKRIFTKLKK